MRLLKSSAPNPVCATRLGMLVLLASVAPGVAAYSFEHLDAQPTQDAWRSMSALATAFGSVDIMVDTGVKPSSCTGLALAAHLVLTARHCVTTYAEGGVRALDSASVNWQGGPQVHRVLPGTEIWMGSGANQPLTWSNHSVVAQSSFSAQADLVAYHPVADLAILRTSPSATPLIASSLSVANAATQYVKSIVPEYGLDPVTGQAIKIKEVSGYEGWKIGYTTEGNLWTWLWTSGDELPTVNRRGHAASAFIATFIGDFAVDTSANWLELQRLMPNLQANWGKAMGGDSGGPLVLRDAVTNEPVVAGLLSRGSKDFDQFLDLRPYASWIAQTKSDLLAAPALGTVALPLIGAAVDAFWRSDAGFVIQELGDIASQVTAKAFDLAAIPLEGMLYLDPKAGLAEDISFSGGVYVSGIDFGVHATAVATLHVFNLETGGFDGIDLDWNGTVVSLGDRLTQRVLVTWRAPQDDVVLGFQYIGGGADASANWTTLSAVPESSSFVMFGTGLAMLLALRRSRKAPLTACPSTQIASIG